MLISWRVLPPEMTQYRCFPWDLRGAAKIEEKIIFMAPAPDDQVSRFWAPGSLLSDDLFTSILIKSRYGSQRLIHPRTMLASFGPCKDPCWQHAAHTKICVGSMQLMQRFVLAACSSCKDLCWQHAAHAKICVGSMQLMQRSVLAACSSCKDPCWQHADHAMICVSNMKPVPRSILATRSSCNDPCRQNAVRVKIYNGSMQVVKDLCWQHVAYRKIHISGTKTMQRFTSPWPTTFIDLCRQHAVCAEINVDSTRTIQKSMWAAYTVARAKFHVGNMKLHIRSM
jgi:hypothetical protein